MKTFLFIASSVASSVASGVVVDGSCVCVRSAVTGLLPSFRIDHTHTHTQVCPPRTDM